MESMVAHCLFQRLHVKIINYFIACVMIICSAKSLAAETIQYYGGKVGHEMHFSLDSTPSAGYSWMVKKIPDELVFVSNEYQDTKSCQAGMVGCPEKVIFHFIAVAPGSGQLVLIYGRPFDKTTWQEKIVDVNIK